MALSRDLHAHYLDGTPQAQFTVIERDGFAIAGWRISAHVVSYDLPAV